MALQEQNISQYHVLWFCRSRLGRSPAGITGHLQGQTGCGVGLGWGSFWNQRIAKSGSKVKLKTTILESCLQADVLKIYSQSFHILKYVF